MIIMMKRHGRGRHGLVATREVAGSGKTLGVVVDYRVEIYTQSDQNSAG